MRLVKGTLAVAMVALELIGTVQAAGAQQTAAVTEPKRGATSADESDEAPLLDRPAGINVQP